jgi:Tol biopolymer transport system component
MTTKRLSRRSMCSIISLAALAACSPATPDPAPTISQSAPTAIATSSTVTDSTPIPSASTPLSSNVVAGQLLTVHRGNFYIFDLSTEREALLTHFPSQSYGSSPALSLDGKQIAYSYYVVPKDPKTIVGQDINLIDRAGVNPRLLRAPSQIGVHFEDPRWTPDGLALVVTVRTDAYVAGEFKNQTFAIQRLPLDGSPLVPVVASGRSPSVSRDGQWLAYLVVQEQSASDLWIADANGKSPRSLLASQSFGIVRSPRFSPNSRHIAFIAMGGPGRPFTMTGDDEDSEEVWEVWTIRPDGSELRRLTDIHEETSLLAWSPDSRWIACAGVKGLYIIAADGNQTNQISTLDSGEGLVWLA